MKKYGPFKLYTPTPGTPAGELARRIKAQYICTPDEQDWYLLQKNFMRQTLKIAYIENGIIIQASYDVSTLWPVNASVAEIPTEQIPKGFTLPLTGANWQYNGQRIVPRVYTAEEQEKMAEQRKGELMAAAERTLAPLERAERLGMATKEETRRLAAWAAYSVNLSRIDTCKAPDIDWPPVPE
ncbi:tail fiber assembly protein [Serratia marcescens]|uniref:tail fiber assembly protein n=1 Tax=Serratia marcescens TaxID=615 RepID=UPI0037D06892